MSDAHEQMEHAEHAQHAASENKKIALLIAILALFLSFSETVGKGAQTEAVDANVKAADTWAFYQAKDTRRTVVTAAADQTALLAAGVSDAAAKAAMEKQIATWRQAASRYESDPKTGRKELAKRARRQEEERDLALAKYHHYELASAAFQIGIVLSSATVITGIAALAWGAGVLGVLGLGLLALGLFAPYAIPLL
ncbi:MAG: DUF4337 domain-containing protein [Xanthobacteraceae bacterium]